MSRTISATNLAEINASHIYEVILVKLAFDTPIYVHSSAGDITYDSNTYKGVGEFGTISNATETEQLRPTSLTLTLSGVDSDHITEALDSGNYGDDVTIYVGYRSGSNDLVDDPVVLWKGIFEFASIEQGEDVSIVVTVQHDLAVLGEKDGGRYTDEDQQTRFSGDVGLQYVADMAGLKLKWGGRPVGSGPFTRQPGPSFPQDFFDIFYRDK